MAKTEMEKMAYAHAKQDDNFVRKQMLYTPEQAKFLRAESERTGRSEADIAREALQKYMDEHSVENREADLLAIIGMWADRTDEEMAEYQAIRDSANRRLIDAEGEYFGKAEAD